VQVWELDEMVSTGIVVGDGSEILAILDYNESAPANLHIVTNSQEEYEAFVQTVDFRTGATLLKIKGGSLPLVSTGDALTVNPDHSVLVYGWSRPVEGFEDIGDAKRTIFGQPEFTRTEVVTTTVADGSPLRFRVDFPPEIPFKDRGYIRSGPVIPRR